jgi:nucleoside-diphosphate-sugar epimerase
MSRVLVTGATGFIGLPVVRALASRGEEIHALHTRPSPQHVPGVRWHRVNLLEEAGLEHLMSSITPERLVHLAWFTERGRVMHAPQNIVWVECSLRLMRSFVRHGGRRMLMLGSGAEYDWSNVEEPLYEFRSLLAPATLYGAAKDALRRLASAYARQAEIELAWGRPFFLYGPYEAPGRLVPSVICSILLNESVAISSGRQVRDYMYVEDLAAAIAALLDSSVVGAVNLASGVGVTLDSMVDQIVRLSGRPDLVLRGGLPDRPWEPPMLVADVSRLRDEVGFQPRWPLAAGLAATVQWWEAQTSRSGEDALEDSANQR